MFSKKRCYWHEQCLDYGGCNIKCDYYLGVNTEEMDRFKFLEDYFRYLNENEFWDDRMEEFE